MSLWDLKNASVCILSATSAQFFRYLWFMPSLGVRSPWLTGSQWDEFFFWRNIYVFVIPWIQIVFRQIDYKDLRKYYRNLLKMKIPSKIIWTHCDASSYGVHSLRVILMQFWGWLHFGLISLLNSLICIRGTFIKTR